LFPFQRSERREKRLFGNRLGQKSGST